MHFSMYHCFIQLSLLNATAALLHLNINLNLVSRKFRQVILLHQCNNYSK